MVANLLHQFLFKRERDGFRAIRHAKFRQDVADVRFGGRVTHAQAIRDLVIVHPFDEQCQHLAFARGQTMPAGFGRRGRGLNQRVHGFRREHRASGRRGANRGGKVFAGNIFDQITDRAGLQRVLHIRAFLKTRQRDDARVRMLFG